MAHAIALVRNTTALSPASVAWLRGVIVVGTALALICAEAPFAPF